MVNNEEGKQGRLDNEECGVLAVFSPWMASLACSLRHRPCQAWAAPRQQCRELSSRRDKKSTFCRMAFLKKGLA